TGEEEVHERKQRHDERRVEIGLPRVRARREHRANLRALCGCSSMVEPCPSKAVTRVRFPPPASPPSDDLGSLFSTVKTFKRDMARELRSEGLSVREIERRLGVARSSVSLWVRDVSLTEAQRGYLTHAPRPGTTTRHRRLREHCGKLPYGTC